MIDLLERLRIKAEADQNYNPHDDGPALLREAADKIERLQLQLGDELPATNSLLFDSIAENERLRAALTTIAGKNDLEGADDCPSAAYAALHECELIARAALDSGDQQHQFNN